MAEKLNLRDIEIAEELDSAKVTGTVEIICDIMLREFGCRQKCGDSDNHR